MIEIRNLTKEFGEQLVLNGISLQVGRETVGLLGSNGSGKTTLIKCLLGLLDYEGEILFDGVDFTTLGVSAKKRIAYIPQYLPVWQDMTARECIAFFAELREVTAKRSAHLLEEFGLGAHAAKRVSALSGGMRQKLSIAIALLSDPEVLLLDEPTANLDAWATHEILNILQKFRGKKTVLLASHRLEEVRSVSDRLVQIKDGKLITPEIGAIRLEATCALP